MIVVTEARGLSAVTGLPLEACLPIGNLASAAARTQLILDAIAFRDSTGEGWEDISEEWKVHAIFGNGFPTSPTNPGDTA